MGRDVRCFSGVRLRSDGDEIAMDFLDLHRCQPGSLVSIAATVQRLRYATEISNLTLADKIIHYPMHSECGWFR